MAASEPKEELNWNEELGEEDELSVVEEIIQGLEKLWLPNEVRELRILETNKGTQSGYFNNMERLAQRAAPFDGLNNVYITLNPVKPELIARANNQIKPYAKNTTSDADIERIAYLPIDLDAERLSGISSTDEEHKAAHKTARAIRKYLKGKGFPNPLYADSGNGAHLLYRVGLPNTEESRDIIKRILLALELKFGTPKVHVDTSVFNPARIWKLYGTTACKGDDTVERPHRRSSIIECPETFETVSLGQLEALAEDLPEMPEPKMKGSVKGKGFVLKKKLEEYGIDIALEAPWQNKGTKYIPEVCPWNFNHTNRSSYIIQFEDGRIAAGCHHASCSGENWSTLREKYEPGWQDHAKNDKDGDDEEQKESQADVLIRIGQESELLNDEIEETYAAVDMGGHTEVIKIKSNRYKMWLTKRFYDETGKAPKPDSMNQALGALQSQALFDGEEFFPNRRVAEKNGIFYYDLADKGHRVIRISPKGCDIPEKPPLLFVRSKNMKGQVEPDFSGSFDSIDRHFRFKGENDRILFAVYLVSCLIPDIPHPVLVLSGEKGAAKSTSMRMVKAIIDPAAQDLLIMPNGKDDLVLALSSSYMPCFDNLDHISWEKSDILCMASTGGSFSKRKLYTDEDETIISFKRCVALNGINVVATRPDLLDRSIVLELERIGEEDRKDESQIWMEFNRDLPKIVGAVFNALSSAMAIHSNVQLDFLPRMADFARWGNAIAEALGIGGQKFIEAYKANLSRANEEAIAAHPVAEAMIALMRQRASWSGSVTELLEELERIAQIEKINTTNGVWPKTPSYLSRRLKEIKSNLEGVGIQFEKRLGSDAKIVTIRNDNVETTNEGGKVFSMAGSVSGMERVRNSQRVRYDGSYPDTRVKSSNRRPFVEEEDEMPC